MRNLKKFLALVLAMMMAFSMMITVNAASTNQEAAFQNAYDKLESYGVFNGYGEVGNDALDKTFTRAQMAAVAYRIATGDTEDEQLELYAQYAADNFTDVKVGDWYAGYVGFCYNYGIVVGVGNNQFAGGRDVTGMEAACMMLRLLGYDQNGEFTGKGWDTKVAALAKRLGITNSLTDADLVVPATRGLAAYIAYRGATTVPQVNYAALLGGYYDNGQGVLIDESTATYTTRDTVWGDPSDGEYSITFQWVYWPNSVTKTVANEPIYTFHDTIIECDLADYIPGFGDDDHYAVTYTNGYMNVNLASYHSYSANTNYNTLENSAMLIEALDTVNKVGQQGRESRVYKNTGAADTAADPLYTIVGVDSFLGVVTSTWDQVVDRNGHVIKEAGASVDVYYNQYAVGTGSNPASSLLTNNNPKLSLDVEGTGFSVGQRIALNVVTAGPNGTTKGAYGTNTGSPANIMSKTELNDTETDYTGKTVLGAVVEDCYDLTVVPVTVSDIVWDSIDGATGGPDNNIPVGIKAGGATYIYNWTFAGTPLNGAALGKTYNLYLDKFGNILDYVETNATAGYGVVLGATVKQVSANQFVIDYTILLPDDTQATVTVGQPETGTPGNPGYVAAGTPWSTSALAEDYYNSTIKFGTLVHYVGAGAYHTFDQVNLITKAQATVKSGRAEAIGKANYDNTATSNFIFGTGTVEPGALVDNNTVFFVAEYMPDTRTPQTVNANDYAFTKYTIYNGFQNLPDLAIEALSEYPAGTAIGNLDIQAFDVDASGNTIAPDAEQYAKYVVINLATKQTTPPAAVSTLNYAFIVANDAMVDEGIGYYTFVAYVNGQKTTLQVALNAGRNIKQNGLYAYSDWINGQGYSNVTLMNGTANTAPDFENPYADLNMEITTGATFKYNNAGVLEGNGTYYTVNSDVAIYLINPTSSAVASNTLSIGSLNLYGQNADTKVWYQLDKYGKIDVIYILDAKVTG